MTRETPVDAIRAVLGLIKAGVRVVQLAPSEIEYNAEMDQGRLMMMLWELSRGNSESKRKAQLCGDAWSEKKTSARDNHTPYGRMCPAWLELEGVRRGSGNRLDFSEAKFRVKPTAVTAVRKIFQWCADGVGTFGILARLNAEAVPPIGRSGEWERSYVKKLLGSVAVLGIYQPHTGSRGPKRKSEGEPIPGYYPAIISESLWQEAHEGNEEPPPPIRPPGKVATQPLRRFAPLCVGRLSASRRGRSWREVRPASASGALQKATGAKWRAFPLAVFVKSVLDQLSELKAADLFSDPGAARLVELQTQLTDVERRLTNATTRFEADPDSQQWQNFGEQVR